MKQLELFTQSEPPKQLELFSADEIMIWQITQLLGKLGFTPAKYIFQ